MRLTIIAGLIMGLSMAVQSALNAHARAKVGSTVKAAAVHVKTIAPWYIATNDRNRAREDN